MHLRAVELSFNLEYWLDDNDSFSNIPVTVKEWCERHCLHKHSVAWAEDWSCIEVKIHNVPQSTVTWLLLSTPHISILNKVEYAPIHPEVLELFDFGDTQ